MKLQFFNKPDHCYKLLSQYFPSHLQSNRERSAYSIVYFSMLRDFSLENLTADPSSVTTSAILKFG